MVSSCGGGAVNRRRLRPLFRGAGCFLPSISCIRALSRDSSFLGLFLPSHRASVDRPNCPAVPTKNKQTLKPSSTRAAHPFTTRTPARSTNSGNMAAEQNEKAYQKQLGVNVGCVSQPRLNPRASPARASPCFFPSTSRAPSTDAVPPFVSPNSFGPKGKKARPGKNGTRYYKNVGLGFKTPREAIEGKSPAPRSRGALRRCARFSGFIRVRGCSQVFGEPSRGSGAGAGTNVDAFRVRIASHTAFGPSPSLPTRSAGDRTAARAAMGTLPASPSRPPSGQPKMMIFRHATPPLMPHERNAHHSSLPPSPRQAPTSTRSAPSPVTCPSAAAS